jgi:hypothetical protein
VQGGASSHDGGIVRLTTAPSLLGLTSINALGFKGGDMLNREPMKNTKFERNPGASPKEKERIKAILRPLVSEAIAELYADQILNEIDLARTPKGQP